MRNKCLEHKEQTIPLSEFSSLLYDTSSNQNYTSSNQNFKNVFKKMKKKINNKNKMNKNKTRFFWRLYDCNRADPANSYHLLPETTHRKKNSSNEWKKNTAALSEQKINTFLSKKKKSWYSNWYSLSISVVFKIIFHYLCHQT